KDVLEGSSGAAELAVDVGSVGTETKLHGPPLGRSEPVGVSNPTTAALGVVARFALVALAGGSRALSEGSPRPGGRERERGDQRSGAQTPSGGSLVGSRVKGRSGHERRLRRTKARAGTSPER